MSIKGLGKSLLVTLPAFFLFACSSSETGEGPTTTEVEETVETAPIVEPVENEEQRMERLNAEARQVRTVYFDFDDDTVKTRYQDLLRAHAWYLSRNPGVQVVVEGHADERGTPEYNLALGERRGNSVRDILMSYGVNSSQMRVVSYGEEKPADPGHNEMSWEKNRRVVLSYEG